MNPEMILTIFMFGGLVLAMMLGVSLSFAMGGISVIAAWILWGTNGFMSIVSPVFNYMWTLLLSAVPLFIFIGVALANSKIAEEMYEAFYLWSGNLRGGLAVGSTGFAAVLSAMTGNCSASTVTANGHSQDVDGAALTVRLAPGCGATLELGMRRYANPPTLAFPWDRD